MRSTTNGVVGGDRLAPRIDEESHQGSTSGYSSLSKSNDCPCCRRRRRRKSSRWAVPTPLKDRARVFLTARFYIAVKGRENRAAGNCETGLFSPEYLLVPEYVSINARHAQL